MLQGLHGFMPQGFLCFMLQGFAEQGLCFFMLHGLQGLCFIFILQGFAEQGLCFFMLHGLQGLPQDSADAVPAKPSVSIKLTINRIFFIVFLLFVICLIFLDTE